MGRRYIGYRSDRDRIRESTRGSLIRHQADLAALHLSNEDAGNPREMTAQRRSHTAEEPTAYAPQTLGNWRGQDLMNLRAGYAQIDWHGIPFGSAV